MIVCDTVNKLLTDPYFELCYYSIIITSHRFHKGQMIFIESKEHGQERLAHVNIT